MADKYDTVVVLLLQKYRMGQQAKKQAGAEQSKGNGEILFTSVSLVAIPHGSHSC